jgi:hypothetical protein
MDNTRTDLFQTAHPNRNNNQIGLPPGSDDNGPGSLTPEEPALTDIDRRMFHIVSSYIKKLPDNITKKHVARLMINFIIKSANL